ncbi:MAG: hypothetical protein NWQ43_08645 [Dolichospermum sp.]|nr:hypothetical protein [Dolichospermum sp.]
MASYLETQSPDDLLEELVQETTAPNHVEVIENVIDTLNGKSNITTNALEGLKVVDIIERIYASEKRIQKVLNPALAEGHES